MAYGKVYLKNEITGEMKVAPVGVSWTVFFFGFFPPLFRSDWKWALIIFLIAIMTFGISNFVFMFIYNRLYLQDALKRNFKITGFSKTTVEEVSHKMGIDVGQFMAKI